MAKLRSVTGVVLVMALVLSLAAQCLVGEDMTAAQMACCAGTDHDCQAAGAAESCCQSEGTGPHQLVIQIPAPVPPLVLVASAVSPLAPPVDDSPAVAELDIATLHAPSPPKYVLLASFLI